MINLDLSYTEAQLQIFFENEKGVRFLVVPKGRRFGATKGAANAFIEWMLEGKKMLWGDTINANIDRYVERYFIPELKASKIPFHWNSLKKLLTLKTRGSGFVDFRSADNPENWEGFGYDIIFLNEAGIILKNEYLFTNAVLPMLMDYPDSLLIAAGVPKGKFFKGKEHRFYTLAKNAISGLEGYRYLKFSSYDNPLLNENDIKDLAEEIGRMNPEMKLQEIYGEFVEGAEGTLWSDVDIERCRVRVKPEFKRVVVSIDPAISNKESSDETGIIVSGLDAEDRAYILEDGSGKYSPDEWSTVAVNLADKWQADCIVAEKNQGGDMVEAVLKGVIKKQAPYRVKLVSATKGKMVRAEPIYAFYERNRVFHVGFFPTLEKQMVNFNGGLSGSPDRVDALVWGLTELLLKKQLNFEVWLDD